MFYLKFAFHISNGFYQFFFDSCMEDLISSLEYRLKVVREVADQVWMPLEAWEKELTELKEKKAQIEDFIARSTLNTNNFDYVQVIADSVQLTLDQGELTTYHRTGNARQIRLIPKKGFDYNNWEHMNSILTANGFEWVTDYTRRNKDEMGREFGEKGWEKWIYLQNSKSNDFSEQPMR